ncbi:MAG TPA: DNA methyltransferase, partial [Candidatus Acidoferrales bacterium]|nr:DNA methyltransferase [Candidatus Acidoferrales bacterium]
KDGGPTIGTNGLFEHDDAPASQIDEDDEDGTEPQVTVMAGAQARRRASILREIAPGEPFLASSSGRKETASYYTARDLVEFLVRETIDPLAAGAEAATILSLRVLDPAMGSGHFLVGALRRLADHLVAAYRRTEEREGEEALPAIVRAVLDDERELVRICRQLVAVHCLHGVDKNPLAIDLARVALWLATAAAGHPLSFLDHRLKCGDSLLGMTPERVLSLEDLRPRHRRGSAQTELLHAGETMVTETDLRNGLNRALEQTFRQLTAFRAIVDDESQDFEFKREMAASVERAMQPLRTLHAARVGRLLRGDEAYQPMLSALKDFATLGHLTDQSRAAIKSWIDARASAEAFCWEIEFPEVFYRSLEDQRVERRRDAGFDIVIGNPPWDKLKLERRRYYERYDPMIVDFQGNSADARIEVVNRAVPDAKAHFEAALEEQRAYVKALTEGPYRWQRFEVNGQRTGGDPDCFKYFTELAWLLAREGGHVGLVTPGAFTSDDGTTGLRHLVLEHSMLMTLFVFENRRKLFEIDSRFKFQVLHFRRGGETSDFEAAFWVHDTDILRKSRHDRAQDSIVIRTEDVRRTSADRLAILEVRSERDLRVARQMLDVAPPLGRTGDSWPLRFGRELDMSQDRRLFHTARDLEAKGGVRDGETYGMPDGARYIPLREGRMIQAFDANAKRYVSGEGRSAVWAENGLPKAPVEPHYWVNVDEIPDDFRRTARRLYWCDVTGPTNERTAMAAVVDGMAISGHSLNALYEPGASELLNTIESVFNSFCFDWYIRLSVGQHMSMNYVLPAPFLRNVPLLNLEGCIAGLSLHTTDYVGRANARAEIDAAVALGYRLSYADFAHVLDSFPLIDRGEPVLEGETKSTITRDLILAAYCRQSGTHDPEHTDRADAARAIGALGYVAEPLRKQIGVVRV